MYVTFIVHFCTNLSGEGDQREEDKNVMCRSPTPCVAVNVPALQECNSGKSILNHHLLLCRQCFKKLN